MKLRVNTQELNAAISTVIKALPVRTTVNVLEGIYMKAKDDILLLRCTDLNIQIDTSIGAEVEEEGAVVLPGKLFAEMVRKLSDGEVLLDIKKNSADITSGRFHTTIQGESAEDYQCMAALDSETVIQMKAESFKRMVRGTIFAAAQDDSKPILTGALLELDETNDVSLVALDGYRLAMRKEQHAGAMEANHLVLPARSLVEIARIISDDGTEMTLRFSKTHLQADMGGSTSITARLMEGEFIKYRQILPSDHKTRVRLERRALLDGLDRVSLLARESNNLIKFTIGSSKINISSNSEIGRSNEEIECSIIGDDIEIAFNSRYFSDVLKVIDDEEVYLDFNNSISPCVVKPVSGEAFYYLVLPVRLFTGM